jgi:DUF4097 and DUF4098 domain-containing protein YvlB
VNTTEREGLMNTFSKTGLLVMVGIAAGAVLLGGLAADPSSMNLFDTKTAIANERGKPDVVEVWNWDGTIASGGSIEVRGVNGKIVAKASSGRKASVTAEKKAWHDTDVDVVEIRVKESGNKVEIWAEYPDSDESDRHHGQDVQVDFVVEVPSGVKFIGSTVNGGISVENLKSPVDLNTVNGSIKFSAVQGASAATVNGSIKARLNDTDTDDEIILETVNGSIELKVPRGTNANFYAETVHGSITSDFPVTMSGQIGPREVSGKIGKGGRDLRLSTVNGSIKLVSN